MTCCHAQRELTGFTLRSAKLKTNCTENSEAQEAEILTEMQQYFVEAKQKAGGIRFDDQSLRSRIEGTVDAWIASSCADKNVNRDLVGRSKV
jgi:hypothetical protein